MRRHRGFTLIELMVVLTVLIIILSIAIPAYRDQVRKSRRAEAISTLGQWQLQLERWRADRPSYADTGIAGYPPIPTGTFYTYEIPVANATGFQIRAEPAGDQVGDACGNYVLTMAGGVVTKAVDPVKTGCW